MPRNAKEPTPTSSPPTVVHQRITEAARLFAQQILHILGTSTLSELTALSRGPVSDPALEPATAPPGRSRPPRPQAQVASPPVRKTKKDRGFLLSIGKLPVQCPVPGCTGRGIRPKNNFCSEHYQTLPKAQQLRLREAQKQAMAEARSSPATAASGDAGRKSAPGRRARK